MAFPFHHKQIVATKFACGMVTTKFACGMVLMVWVLMVAAYAVILSVTDFAYILQFAEYAILKGLLFAYWIRLFMLVVSTVLIIAILIPVLQDSRD